MRTMLKVGITGGIGSGKSTVCQVFETLGIPVFYADKAARTLTNTDESIIRQLKSLFGDDIYTKGELDRSKVALTVFTDKNILIQLNAIIHPATIEYGRNWMLQQSGPYALKEAAIFFETGSNKEMDIMIGVYAPAELRIERTMHRDKVSREKVAERIALQMNEEEKMKLCDFVINNDGNTAVIPQVLNIHKRLLARAS
jgi:dephospho-CoA kinase